MMKTTSQCTHTHMHTGHFPEIGVELQWGVPYNDNSLLVLYHRPGLWSPSPILAAIIHTYCNVVWVKCLVFPKDNTMPLTLTQ